VAITVKIDRLDGDNAINLCVALTNLPESDLYIFDFENLQWSEPFGMLLFSRQLRSFADGRKPAKCRAINHERHSYLAHMGFFQAFGLEFGNNPGEAAGSRQYLPVTRLSREELEAEAERRNIDVREAIEHRCEALSEVLVRARGGPAFETLTYSLREVFRNVLEHSGADDIWFAAQCWPGKFLVELSILDQGMGLKSTLSRNPHLVVDSDRTALKLALLPGISSVAYKGKKTVRNDVWANSGYGLFMTSEICAVGGSFLIVSGSNALEKTESSERLTDAAYAGTALRLRLRLDRITSLSERLESLRERGATISSQLRGSQITASMSSRMLLSHFSKNGEK
jgi:hypothetical protein